MNRMVNNEKNKKFFMIVFWLTFAVAIAIFIGIFVSVNNKFKEASEIGLLTINTTESIVPNESGTLSASSTQDKTINGVRNIVANLVTGGMTGNVSAGKITSEETEPETSKATSSVIDEPEVKEDKELSFIAPVAGEIITDFAKESLVYSKTLDEWTTHLGIDIKADKTSSVVASEDGVVKSVKSDPRYGLTVILSHGDGYETLYANLQTADFVKEGDTVSKNQTIGTVGETSSFEISDPPHLHFEMFKDGENVNPTTLMKYIN